MYINGLFSVLRTSNSPLMYIIDNFRLISYTYNNFLSNELMSFSQLEHVNKRHSHTIYDCRHLLVHKIYMYRYNGLGDIVYERECFTIYYISKVYIYKLQIFIPFTNRDVNKRLHDTNDDLHESVVGRYAGQSPIIVSFAC